MWYNRWCQVGKQKFIDGSKLRLQHCILFPKRLVRCAPQHTHEQKYQCLFKARAPSRVQPDTIHRERIWPRGGRLRLLTRHMLALGRILLPARAHSRLLAQQWSHSRCIPEVDGPLGVRSNEPHRATISTSRRSRRQGHRLLLEECGDARQVRLTTMGYTKNDVRTDTFRRRWRPCDANVASDKSDACSRTKLVGWTNQQNIKIKWGCYVAVKIVKKSGSTRQKKYGAKIFYKKMIVLIINLLFIIFIIIWILV